MLALSSMLGTARPTTIPKNGCLSFSGPQSYYFPVSHSIHKNTIYNYTNCTATKQMFTMNFAKVTYKYFDIHAMMFIFMFFCIRGSICDSNQASAVSIRIAQCCEVRSSMAKSFKKFQRPFVKGKFQNKNNGKNRFSFKKGSGKGQPKLKCVDEWDHLTKKLLKAYPDQSGSMVKTEGKSVKKYFKNDLVNYIEANNSELIGRPPMGLNLNCSTIEAGIEVLKKLKDAPEKTGVPKCQEYFSDELLEIAQLLQAKQSSDKKRMAEAVKKLLQMLKEDPEEKLKELGKLADASSRLWGLAIRISELIVTAKKLKHWAAQVPDPEQQYSGIKRWCKEPSADNLAKGIAGALADLFHWGGPTKTKKSLGDGSSSDEDSEEASGNGSDEESSEETLASDSSDSSMPATKKKSKGKANAKKKAKKAKSSESDTPKRKEKTKKKKKKDSSSDDDDDKEKKRAETKEAKKKADKESGSDNDNAKEKKRAEAKKAKKKESKKKDGKKTCTKKTKESSSSSGTSGSKLEKNRARQQQNEIAEASFVPWIAADVDAFHAAVEKERGETRADSPGTVRKTVLDELFAMIPDDVLAAHPFVSEAHAQIKEENVPCKEAKAFMDTMFTFANKARTFHEQQLAAGGASSGKK